MTFATDMLHTKRVALSGGPWVGKSTLARHLQQEHGFLLLDKSLRVKELAVVALQAIGIPITIFNLVLEKEKYRPFLEEFGAVIGIDDEGGLESWFSEVFGKQLSSGFMVFDSARSIEQVRTLHALGFRIVELTLPAEERRQRAHRLGVNSEEFERVMSHGVEQCLPRELVDYHLPASLSTNSQAQILLELMGA